MLHWSAIKSSGKSTTLTAGFQTDLDQEEGDTICPQRPRQFDIFHFSFDLRHFATVLVLLKERGVMCWASEHCLCNHLMKHLSKAQCNQTWNIFFSAPLCFIYSLGRNSFRLEIKKKYFKTLNFQQINLKYFYTLFIDVSLTSEIYVL